MIGQGFQESLTDQKDFRMKLNSITQIILSGLFSILLFGCGIKNEINPSLISDKNQAENTTTVNAEFTLKTLAEDGKLLFIGVGGEIDGVINPDLVVSPGTTIRILLVNGDGMPHDLFIPDLDVKTEYVKKIKDQSEIVFKVEDLQPGNYVYYCTLPGHRKAGQEGRFIVEGN